MRRYKEDTNTRRKQRKTCLLVLTFTLSTLDLKRQENSGRFITVTDYT